MFPPTCTGIAALCRMCPTSEVVVVFPFVPVIPMTGPCRYGAASSTSPDHVDTARALRARCRADREGTPGESTIRSQALSNSSSVCSRKPGTSCGFRSVAVTSAPRARRNSAAALPRLLHPDHQLVPAFICSFKVVSANSASTRPDNPEPRDDFRFLPSERLEVMVDRRHFENSFSSAACNFPPAGSRSSARSRTCPPIKISRISCLIKTATTPIAPPKRKRTHIAHENIRRMSIPPQKPQTRARHRTAENRQFRRARIARQLQIVGELAIAAGISKHGQSARRNHHQTDRKPIETVGDVDGIARPHHDRTQRTDRTGRNASG